MAINPNNGVLDIINGTLKVSSIDIKQAAGFTTALNTVARNDVLLFDDQKASTVFTPTSEGGYMSSTGVTRDTTGGAGYIDLNDGWVYWPIQLPNSWHAEFDMHVTTTGGVLTFSLFNTSEPNHTDYTNNDGGYKIVFDNTNNQIDIYWEGSIHKTVGANLRSSDWQHVNINYFQGAVSVSLAGKVVLTHEFTQNYQEFNSRYVGFSATTGASHKIRHLRVHNSDKWLYTKTSNASDITYVSGNVGIGSLAPTELLDVHGNVHIAKDLTVDGNLRVSGTTTFIDSTNLVVEDPIIELAKGNTSDTIDAGLIVTRGASNVAIAFRGDEEELAFGYTQSGASGTDVTPIANGGLDVRVYGNLFANNLTTTANVDASYINGNVVTSNLMVSGEYTMGGRIIPDTNDAYDIGSAEKKIRDLYVADNSLWIGDETKISFSSGKMRFRKRKKNVVPAAILAAGGTATAAKTFSSKANLTDIKTHEWLNYMKTLGGKGNAIMSDVFRNNDDDYEATTAAEAWKDINDDIFSESSVSIGKTSPPTVTLDVEGDGKFSGNVVTTGNIGIRTATPSANLHVMGYQYVNGPPTLANAFDHSDAPLTLTHDTATSSTAINDPKPLLHLTRSGTNNESYGARASFNLSRYENSSTHSRSRLDVALADGTYAESTVMTLRADGKVGVGTDTPAYTLDVAGDINLSGDFYQGGSPFVSSLWTDGTDSLYYRSNVEVGTANLFVDTTTSNVGIGTSTPGYTLDVHGTANVGALTATSISGPLSGNADTATALQTARTIGGESFDGTANIDLPGVNTAGTQNTSGNAATAAALQTARTIGGESFDGTANIDLPGVNTAGTQNTSGNAATAAALQTARTIGGESFDGTANIDLPGVNTAGTQNTSGNAATATALQTARTIGGESFDGTANIDLPGVNTAGTQNTSGNAATAAALETARTIGGESFDGTANIDLPGVNTAGTQNTSGNAATAAALETARTIALTGDVTGSATFDGSGNISISTTSSGGGSWTTSGSDIYYNSGNVGIGTNNPGFKLHMVGTSYFTNTINIQPSSGGGGQNLFTGYRTGDSYGRAQLVLSSGYSDVIIASSQANNNHGSNLSFVTYNPSNSGDYRKFVINQGNWGSRKQFLDFGYADKVDPNPHAYINSTDTVLTLDGINKRVGIGNTTPGAKLDVNGSMTVGGNTNLGNGNGDSTHINDILYLGATDSGDSHFYFGENSSNWYGEHWYWDSGHTANRYSRHAGTDTLIERHDTRYTHKIQTNRAYERIGHSTGYQIGSYNSVGGNSTKTNPIYTIGDNYRPSDTSLGDMYGIGYSHGNFTSILTGGWGMYVAADGDARIGFNGSSGHIKCTGHIYCGNTVYVGGSTSRGLRSVSGNYGTVQTTGGGAGDWEGYSIDGRYVFMSADNNSCGIYNDVDNDWMIYCYRNAYVQLRYNDSNKFETMADGTKTHGQHEVTGFKLRYDGDYWSARLWTAGFYNNDDSSSTFHVSVYAHYWVRGDGLLASSDERVKTDIQTLDTGIALSKLEKIRPVSYKMKNTGEFMFGFIGQEIEKELPNVVNLDSGTITDFNIFGVFSNKQETKYQAEDEEKDVFIYTLTLEEPIPSTFDVDKAILIEAETTGDTIQFFYDPEYCGKPEIGGTVMKLLSKENDDVKESARYKIIGTRVHDFRSLDYNEIFTVTTAALKEVNEQLKAEKIKTASLETQLASVLARLDALEASN